MSRLLPNEERALAPGAAVVDRPRLLSAWRASGRSDLGAHLDHHGPLPRVDLVDAGRLIEALDATELLGRGGGGFPAGRKLDIARRRRAGTVVANLMEGEPASAKDATLALHAPHLVLDGAQLAAAVSGARQVIVCVADHRAETAALLARAVAERRSSPLWEVPTEIARPPGRYVAGEESALVDWLKRRRGVPLFRPDKGTPLTLGGSPAVVHNAETLAQVALVSRAARDGGRLGPDDLTTLVTVSGAVRYPGVQEVAVGTPLDEVIDAAGPASAVAAALVGGFGGAWLDATRLPTPFRSADLRAAGAAPGAGAIVVVPRAACGLAETAAVAAYMAGESAGQCGPCVYGLAAVAEDLARLAAGRPDRSLLTRLHRRLGAVDGRGACRHPDGVARMVRSALEVFADDVAGHAAGRPCPHAGRRVITCIP